MRCEKTQLVHYKSISRLRKSAWRTCHRSIEPPSASYLRFEGWIQLLQNIYLHFKGLVVKYDGSLIRMIPIA